MYLGHTDVQESCQRLRGAVSQGHKCLLEELTTSQRWDGFRMEKKNDCNGLKHIEYIKIHHNIRCNAKNVRVLLKVTKALIHYSEN